MVKFLDLASQYRSIKEEIDLSIEKTIEKSAFIGGSDLGSFESEFAAYQGAKHCIGVGNGTDSLEIIIEALDLPKGSEIVVPANSFIASSEAVTRSGCRVVFADVDDLSYTLDIDDLERRITPATSAIMAVHLYGHPAKMSEIATLADRHGLKVIEDCAQAHGAEYQGQRIGAIGAAGSFSFYPGKNLGAYGDGGAIVTNDSELAKRCRMIANHGRVDKYDHQFEGRNSRLDGLQAAILRVKLRHLDGWVEKRNAVADAYLKGLADIAGLYLPERPTDVRHAFHLFVIRCDHRDALKEHLASLGVETGIHYPIALPKLAAYQYLGGADKDMFANRSDGNLLSLPIGEHLTEGDVMTVISAVRTFPGFAG